MAAVDREAMFNRATEEPRLMRERRQETPKERQIAFIGTSNLGETYDGQLSGFEVQVRFKPTYANVLLNGIP